MPQAVHDKHKKIAKQFKLYILCKSKFKMQKMSYYNRTVNVTRTRVIENNSQTGLYEGR